MRDLKSDLELCEKATPGPWEIMVRDGVIVIPEIVSGANGYSGYYNPPAREDAEFIISSRTGWPHAIERALKAEAEVERMKRRAEVLDKALSLARTSWPHAIKRALKAEAEVERMKRRAEVLDKALSLATASLTTLLMALEPDRHSFAEREAYFHTAFLDQAEKSISEEDSHANTQTNTR